VTDYFKHGNELSYFIKPPKMFNHLCDNYFLQKTLVFGVSYLLANLV
jgi:hypothetical protein